MKFATAKRLLREDIEKMDLLTLQKHKVRLLDAWRFADINVCEAWQPNGKLDGVVNGFFVELICDGVEPTFVPRDWWLAKNLKTTYERCVEIEKQILSSPE